MPLERAEITVLTPAQARVDAVARTMDAAMNRASTLTLTPEEVTALKADFPDEAFKPGAAGKENLIYIEHAFLRDRFDQVIGMGQWAILRTRPHWAEEFETQKREKAVRIYADCALLVRGCMVSESIGEMVYYPNNAAQNYGDAAEGAVTAAFRRCAKNFGVGLQAWKKDFGEGWWARRKGGRPAPARQYSVTPPTMPSDDDSHFESAKPAKPVQQEMPVTHAPGFKNASERSKWLSDHLSKCRTKLTLDTADEPVAFIEFLKKSDLLMPNETMVANVNLTTLFASVPLSPDERESDADWKARVNEAIARDANQIKRNFASFLQGDQLEGASAPELEPQAPALPDGAKEMAGFIKLVNHKPTAKGGTKHGILVVDDMGDREGGMWLNTFDDKDAAEAERLKGQEVAFAYTEGKYGNDLCKHAIREVR